MPHFVCYGENVREAIVSMPGISRVSIDNLLFDLESDLKLGIKVVLLFGITENKDCKASEAYDPDGIVQRAVVAIKKRFPDILVITDVCLCEYTDHGHCGIVSGDKILNDETTELLAKSALSHAEAGVDIVAPSDMMDGRVFAIRQKLEENNFPDVGILSYSAKYSSSFYGPFREAADSAPQFGDRKTYQMDFRNSIEAEKEILQDINEGADMVMVKPALAYLDVIRRAKEISTVPVCAYNVSGEYSMVKISAQHNLCNERDMVIEILTSIFRAGADNIISYHTRDILKNKWI